MAITDYMSDTLPPDHQYVYAQSLQDPYYQPFINAYLAAGFGSITLDQLNANTFLVSMVQQNPTTGYAVLAALPGWRLATLPLDVTAHLSNAVWLQRLPNHIACLDNSRLVGTGRWSGTGFDLTVLARLPADRICGTGTWAAGNVITGCGQAVSAGIPFPINIIQQLVPIRASMGLPPLLCSGQASSPSGAPGWLLPVAGVSLLGGAITVAILASRAPEETAPRRKGV